MKCPACSSVEQKVMSTRAGTSRTGRLRRCNACGHRWNTIELTVQELQRLEVAVAAMRTFMDACKEIGNACTQQV